MTFKSIKTPKRCYSTQSFRYGLISCFLQISKQDKLNCIILLFVNKFNEKTCSLASYHRYNNTRRHVLGIYEKIMRLFENILTAKDS